MKLGTGARIFAVRPEVLVYSITEEANRKFRPSIKSHF